MSWEGLKEKKHVWERGFLLLVFCCFKSQTTGIGIRHYI